MGKMMDLSALKDPFPPEDIEWRIGRAGKNDKGIWAKVLAYITSRAIMDRLDAVCGPGRWQTDFRDGGGHLQAGIGILIDEEWVWKWDGTGLLEASGGLSGTDAGKGDFSNALKRVAVQWGVGRYLYNLDEGWATIHKDGSHYARLPQDKGGDSFRWDPPALPEWALPGGSGKADPGETKNVNRDTGEIPGGGGQQQSGPECPKCNSPLWDNRDKKESGDFSEKSPDYACKDKEGCGWAFWIDGATERLEKALDGLVNTGTIKPEAKDNCLDGVREGGLDSFRIAQDWVRQKQKEANQG